MKKTGAINRLKRYVSIVIILIVASSTIYSIAFAVKFSISTNDASGVQEWFDQSIPVFQTDAIAGGDIRPDEDIVNAWVATGTDNQLYFMVEMAENPAISKSDQPYNGVGVQLDCNSNGVMTDDVDRFVFYYYANGYDRVSWFRGNDGNGSTIDDANLGQIDGQYVEWTIPNTFANGMLLCTSQLSPILVKFMTGQSDNAAGYQVIKDETDSFRGFNAPTAIQSSRLEVKKPFILGIPILVVSICCLMAYILMVAFLHYKRRIAVENYNENK